MLYSTIYIYETNFQKSVVEHLIELDKFDSTRILIINAVNHKIRIEDEVYNINFNKIEMLYSSLKGVRALQKRNISCNTLVSTHIHGINALFLSAFFSSKSKILIDDGIGTPVLIQNQNIFKRKWKWQIRFIIIKFLLYLNNVQMKSIRTTLSKVDKYFTVYKPVKSLKLPFLIHYLNFYKKQFKTNLNEVCFIGTPLIDFKLCNEILYKDLLLSAKQKYGDFKYYLHPDEQITLLFKIKGIKFIKLTETVEEHFLVNGVPEIVIGFTSSVLLNLSSSKYISTRPKFLYINKDIYGPKYDKYYYEVFEQNNILNSELYI